MAIVGMLLRILALLGIAVSIAIYVVGGQNKRGLEERLSVAETERLASQAALEETVAERDALAAQIDPLENELQSTRDLADALGAQNQRLRNDLERMRSQVAATRETLQALQSDYENLNEQILAFDPFASSGSLVDDQLVADLQARIAELEGQLNLAVATGSETMPVARGSIPVRIAAYTHPVVGLEFAGELPFAAGERVLLQRSEGSPVELELTRVADGVVVATIRSRDGVSGLQSGQTGAIVAAP